MLAVLHYKNAVDLIFSKFMNEHFSQNVELQLGSKVFGQRHSFCSFASAHYQSGFYINQDVIDVQTSSFNSLGFTKRFHQLFRRCSHIHAQRPNNNRTSSRQGGEPCFFIASLKTKKIKDLESLPCVEPSFGNYLLELLVRSKVVSKSEGSHH